MDASGDGGCEGGRVLEGCGGFQRGRAGTASHNISSTMVVQVPECSQISQAEAKIPNNTKFIGGSNPFPVMFK